MKCAAAKKKAGNLTTPDLVLLSLLAERPMHGYEANLQLESRMVRDWAGISRPQVYYSLEKLARLGLIRSADSDGTASGPERCVFTATAPGRAALANALEREDWTNQQDRPAFLTWMALSWQARPGIFLKQVRLRRKFLENQLQHRQDTLRDIRKEVGHSFHEAVWMVTLTIQQIRVELRWLRKLTSEFPHRAPARHPQYIGDHKQ
jgi:DNA-binding PadR family transcriptional regulator